MEQKLRAKRFDSGALRLDNAKILFALDGNGNPCEAFQYITKDSNHLVEEFMLLANRSVRRSAKHEYPEQDSIGRVYRPAVTAG